ncbi:ferrochelatase [Pengzhenrongella frigida]|uniref:Coproporphyrin III ferrochelatase n=1 Tax=Pengzhenrongella frigida TaxID=1259133 RepID=A0A4Q5MVN3_9MICO|nr:ferrochelatase [Cellulomonas sp. HLT2-17]
MHPAPARPDVAAPAAAPYDAILLYSFGGPDGPDDVLPFLRNVTRGKNIPEARLVTVGAHYDLFGGRSPINGQNLELLAALRAELARRGVDLPIAWGNRNWKPYAIDALAELREQGAHRVLALVTSAYGSYSGCRQYREHLARTLAELADRVGGDVTPGDVLAVDKLRHYFNHPGFVSSNADAVVEAYGELGDAAADAPLVFVTHSIPDVMEAGSGAQRPSYRTQHLEVAELVAAQVSERIGRPVEWHLAFCSRSGAPHQPWLEPDVNDLLGDLATAGTRSVVMSPIGFVSDHMEVAFDLDIEAMETARELGLTAVRAGTVSTRPAFVAGLIDLVLERAAAERGEDVARVTTGALGAWPDTCRPGCCRQSVDVDSGIPAACGQDSDPTQWSVQ